jgi:hypothetical protein
MDISGLGVTEIIQLLQDSNHKKYYQMKYINSSI